MKVFVLIAFIPSLIVAEILCPDSKTSCPEEKECCEVDGEYSCCDPDDDRDTPATRLKVFPGDEIMSSIMFDNASLPFNVSLAYYDSCTISTCDGTCCTRDGCCPYKMATCCDANRCCPSLSQCCTDGCCKGFQKCCGSGCCDFGAACCGTWCCKEGYRCGRRHMTCRSKGATMYPGIIVLFLVAANVLFSHRF